MLVDIVTLHYYDFWGSADVDAVTEHGDASCVLAVFASRQAAMDWSAKNGHEIAGGAG